MHKHGMHINYLMYRAIPYDGYGRYGIQQIKALHRVGVSVYPDIITSLEMPGWMQRLRGFNTSNLTISLMPPHDLPGLPGRQWNSTMYECSRLREGWGDHINQKAERVIVPSEWLVDVCRKSGVKKRVPVHVVHGGVEVDEFPIIDGPVPEHRPYTFLAFGDRGTRKGMDTAWQAFYRAFGEEKHVRLVVKARPVNLTQFSTAFGDPRISIWREDVQSLSEVFSQVDCFVFPTKGEGWGMPPRECAAMGIPVITTRWSGTEVGIDHWAIPIEKYTMRPSSITNMGGGEWAVPDVDEVAEHMRWCFEHRDTAKQSALKAAQWLRDNQTWEHSARQLVDLIEKWG